MGTRIWLVVALATGCAAEAAPPAVEDPNRPTVEFFDLVPEKAEHTAPPSGSAPGRTTITANGVGLITKSSAPVKIVELYAELDDLVEVGIPDDDAHDIHLTKSHKPQLVVTATATEIIQVAVLGDMFSTPTGISVGATRAELTSKYPDLACRVDKPRLHCESPTIEHVSFELSTSKKHRPRVTKIVWTP